VTAPGRRETHKRETREALLSAARRMFATRGFDDTTVRDIAEAAGVAERTFFRYFASKDDLVYSELLDLLPLLHQGIVSAPARLPVPLAVRDALLVLAAGGVVPVVLFSGPPILRQSRPGAMRGLMLTIESRVADAIGERMAPTGTRFQAEVLARVSIAAMRSCLLAYHAAGGAVDAPPGLMRRLVTEAFGLIAPQSPVPASDRARKDSTSRRNSSTPVPKIP
jgi:AcrR family transcriptional regulator